MEKITFTCGEKKVTLYGGEQPAAPLIILNNYSGDGESVVSAMQEIDTPDCNLLVVGDLNWTNVGLETLAIDALRDVPVRMISYGGSNHNISLLIRAEDKQRALQQLSKKLFGAGE